MYAFENWFDRIDQLFSLRDVNVRPAYACEPAQIAVVRGPVEEEAGRGTDKAETPLNKG